MTERTSLRELTQSVCGESLIVRTGIVLVDPQYIGSEADECARTGLGSVNMPRWLLGVAESDGKFLDISPTAVMGALERLCSQTQGDRCMGVVGFDLLLAGMNASERPQVWRVLRVGFRKRPRALLFFMPTAAKDLLPSPKELEGWQSDNRVAYLS